MADRVLYYGDNLYVLRDHIGDESVNLIYLDPPFNSSRGYNILFKDEGGREAEAQVNAFCDSWRWEEAAENTYQEILLGPHPAVAQMIYAMRQFIGENRMMAYLVMMTVRLVELHRVLVRTGSLYLHCDPTASHYLKIILDTIFGADKFRAEIIWKRTSAHSSANRPGPIHDTILYYVKSSNFVWNKVYQPYSENYIQDTYRNIDLDGRRWKSTDITGAGTRNGETGKVWHGIDVTAKGRHWFVPPAELDKLEQAGKLYWPFKLGGMPRLKQYLNEMPGLPLQDIWDDIPPLGAQAAERLGYPTQKPLSLLERIIESSSNPGDVVLDSFSGCGTSITAAEKLKRRWIGIDITHLAITMHKNRLKEMFGLLPDQDYEVVGEPNDLAGAHQLAQDNRYQFQWWALSLIQGRPVGGETNGKKGKKGADRGIDGIITFIDDYNKKLKRVIIQVKSGHVKPGDVRDLRGVLDREEDAPIGLFITLENPSQEMVKEAVSAGFYYSPLWEKNFPRIQILTVDNLLKGISRIQLPTSLAAFKEAQRVRAEVDQLDLFS
jgi:site-specific DNA-methyltransferase (adenine-specific)